MRVFCAAKPAEFEAAFLEKSIRFKHPEDDPAQFAVADGDVDLVDEIARQLAIYAYLKDGYVTDEVALGARTKDSTDL